MSLRWCTLALLSALPARAADLSYWYDGQAELAGYALVQPRYGQLRAGTAVLIFVKEDFSDSLRVKADPGVHPASDVFPVMKLNAVKDFQTGIYDYNLMLSAFVGLAPHAGRPAGAAAKVAFSAQEWCGLLHEQLLFDAQEVRRVRHSYFDQEADESATMKLPAGGLTVDAAPILVRGLPVALLARGQEKKLPVLPSLERTRLLHRKLAWGDGALGRSASTQVVEVPAGRFEVETWTLTLENGERYVYQVEAAHPHRLVAWTGPDGESARLLGVERMKYWELNQEGGEKALARLGLPVPGRSR